MKTRNEIVEEIVGEATRDICDVSVAPASKSRVREIITSALTEHDKREYRRGMEEERKEMSEKICEIIVQTDWANDSISGLDRLTELSDVEARNNTKD